MAVSTVKQTKLWPILVSKLNNADVVTIENACNKAEDLLSRIPDTFPTYTLHDATHSKNVCDIIFELLGNKADDLTGLEVSFLILSAFYHDTGMVYKTEDKDFLLNSQEFQMFLKEHRYACDRVKASDGQIPDDIAEWFLRLIHPQRMEYVPEIVIGGMAIKQELAALCKSHGSNVAEILSYSYKDLTDFPQGSADLVLCAVLLRLADILDFDQSRSSEILYEYLKLKDANTLKFETSKKEFLKHKGALGFTFPNERQEGYKIRFNALCENIEIEHDIRLFLNFVIRELRECNNLLFKYKTKWDIKLPIGIEMKDSFGANYQYGQYLFTVEPEKAIELFTGENLYSDRSVFVRELIQNSIDTVLHCKLYAKFHHDSNYKPEIHITTWTDEENYQWIRIDDNGMGMDNRKILEYFLKAGVSYYNSAEFADEISLYKEIIGNFTPVSRFGIGVLSCFLAGDKIDVSTRTHNSKSVRLSMGKGDKYFKTQLEEKGHKADLMPNHPDKNNIGYRNMHGTSIAVRVAPYQHFSELNFAEIVKKHVSYPPVSIYLNDKKFIDERELLAVVEQHKTGILEFPVPKAVIEEAKRIHRVTIHSDAVIKVRFINLADYISKQNQGFIKGALVLMDAHLPYTDDFYEENKGFLRKDKSEMAKVKVFINGQRLMLSVHRFFYSVIKSKLPLNEKNWYLENTNNRHGNIDFGVNLLEIQNDLSSYIAPQTSQSYKSTDSILMQNFAHNGITYFSEELEGNSLNIPYEHLLIILCNELYRPELSLSREKVQSISIELLSEIYLVIRKVFDEFKIDSEISSGYNSLYKDFISSFYYYRLYSSITANRIHKISNFDTGDGKDWSDYFSVQDIKSEKKGAYSFLSFKSLTDIIYATWIQKHKSCKLIKQQNGKYKLVIDSIISEYNQIIYDYYPPLFFLPVDGEQELFVRHDYLTNDYDFEDGSCGFINLHNPDAERIIAITEALYNGYSALFRALVRSVRNGEKDSFYDLLNKIKALPLWKNL